MAEYKKYTPDEHVLRRPGMYIGDIEATKASTWLYRGSDDSMYEKEISYPPGLFQIFLEILTNATDHAIRMDALIAAKEAKPGERVTRISVDVSDDGKIVVQNNGRGIDSSKHAEYKIHVPELIFGNLLTSSNYDDNDRNVAGQNGIGAKATNIFSKFFHVESVDRKRKKLYSQKWYDNMTRKEAPEITKLTAGSETFTRVTFVPDYERFGLRGITPDIIELFRKSAVDACAVTPKTVGISFNGREIPVKTFKQYAGMFFENEKELVFDSFEDGWEVAVGLSPDNFRHVSFVNGLFVPCGGKHVDLVERAITSAILKKINGKKQTVTAKSVRNALWVFVKSNVKNPSFNSQNKHTLTSKVSASYNPSDGFVKNVLSKTGIQARINALTVANDEKKLKKTDGAQRNTITGIPKLDDANWAGTRRSAQCTLILTEGDSAKSTAIAGLSVVGRDKYGVFPLRGKLLNVRDSAVSKISENEEIKAIKKIMGLESGKSYTTAQDAARLRYGSIMILTDQDVDGFHIKGLILNFFDSLWPELARRENFITALLTPIVKAKKRNRTVSFYSMPTFEDWRRDHPGWSIKYYKGLGTSTGEDAKEYFKEMKVLRYTCNVPGLGGPPDVKLDLSVNQTGERVALRLLGDDPDSLDMAFRKNRAEERKQLIDRLDLSDNLDYDQENVSYGDFVRKELALFSWDDVSRSLPGFDGLKRSQRKVLFGVKKSASAGGQKETRVAQFAAYVSQVSSYHHGEASLQQTIIGMAQNFVGRGHVQLLTASGQFGTRLMGGDDHASARYIHTQGTDLVEKMFPKEDEAILVRSMDDDYKPVEPIHYLPVLPLVLLNGAHGIGTGYSTSLPCFDPRVVLRAYRDRLSGGGAASFAALDDMQPCYRGFKGSFHKNGDMWYSLGCFARRAGGCIEVTELPVGTWTQKYKELLEKLVADPKSPVTKYESHYTTEEVLFKVYFSGDPPKDDEEIVTALSLRSKGMSMANIHLLNTEQKVRKFDGPRDIAEYHYSTRLAGYVKRLEHLRLKTRFDLSVVNARVEFVRQVIEKELEIISMTEDALVAHFQSRGWPLVGDSYSYLLGMAISTLTKDRYKKLKDDERDQEALLSKLEGETPQSIWLQDLDRLNF